MAKRSRSPAPSIASRTTPTTPRSSSTSTSISSRSSPSRRSTDSTRPASKPTPLTDYNYFLIHGSHDGDVSSFSGLAQYERLHFTGDSSYFKSAIYVYRANHGQWNTVWGSLDGGKRSARYLDIRGLISKADQRRFAEVYITAFLEATLRGSASTSRCSATIASLATGCPRRCTSRASRRARFHAAADYEEDVDVTSGSVPGVTLDGDSLATWKEAVIPYRWKGSNQGHNAVTIGWNNRIAGDDTTKRGMPASYSLTLADSLRGAWRIDARQLARLLARAHWTPSPGRAPPRRTAPRRRATPRRRRRRHPSRSPKPKAKKPERDSIPMDLSIEAVDAGGHVARVALSAYGVPRRPLEAFVYRRAGRDKERFANTYEIVLQTYTIPLADFAQAAPGFDPSRLVTVRWRMDRTEAGTFMLDNIGFARLPAAFDIPAGGRLP